MSSDDDDTIPATQAPASVLDVLRSERRALAEDKHRDFDVPGYSRLVVRYRPAAWERLREIATRAEKSRDPRRELNAQADVLIAMCDGLFVRDDDGQLVPLGGDDDPIRYDQRLADALEYTASGSARAALFGLFDNDYAVTIHHNEVMEWLRDTNRQDDVAFVGEDDAATR